MNKELQKTLDHAKKMGYDSNLVSLDFYDSHSELEIITHVIDNIVISVDKTIYTHDIQDILDDIGQRCIEAEVIHKIDMDIERKNETKRSCMEIDIDAIKAYFDTLPRIKEYQEEFNISGSLNNKQEDLTLCDILKGAYERQEQLKQQSNITDNLKNNQEKLKHLKITFYNPANPTFGIPSVADPLITYTKFSDPCAVLDDDESLSIYWQDTLYLKL